MKFQYFRAIRAVVATATVLTNAMSFPALAEPSKKAAPSKTFEELYRIQQVKTALGRVSIKERKNKKGKVVERTFITEGWTETQFARPETGILYRREFKIGDSELVFKAPTKRGFGMLDITEHRKKNEIHMRFMRQKNGRYFLYAAYRKPQRVFYAETVFSPPTNDSMSFYGSGVPDDFVVGCMTGETANTKGALDLASQVSKGTDIRSVLEKNVLGASCNVSPYSDSKDQMLDAMVKVFGSDKGFSNAESTKTNAQHQASMTAQKTAKPTFLACLRAYDMDAEASRIANSLDAYVTQSQGQPQSMPPSWNIECSNADVQGKTQFYPKDSAHVGPSIYMCQKDGTQFKANDFASIFFHEMLHAANIANDGIVAPIVNCCSDTAVKDPTAKAASCSQVEQIVLKQKNSQILENAFLAGNGPEKIKALQDQLNTAYGSSDAQQRLGDLFDQVAQADVESPACQANASSDACRQARQANVQKAVDDHFPADCALANDVTYCQAARQTLINDLDANGLSPCRAASADASASRSGALALLFGPSRAIAACAPGTVPAFSLSSIDYSTGDYSVPVGESQQSAYDGGYTSGTVSGSANAVGNSSTVSSGSTGIQIGPSTTSLTHNSGFKAGGDGQHMADFAQRNTARVQQIDSYLNGTDASLQPTKSAIAQVTAALFSPDAKASANGSVANQQVIGMTIPDPTAILTAKAGAPAPSGAQVSMQPDRAAVSDGSSGSGSDRFRERSSSNGSASSVASGSSSGSGGLGVSVGRGPASSGTGANTSGSSAGASVSGAGQTAGMINKKLAVEKPADPVAVKAFLISLQKPYAKVKVELGKSIVQKMLLKYKILIVDADGRVHGNANPVYKFVYNEGLDQLVMQKRANGGE